MGITDIDSFLRLTASDLASGRNIGRKTLDELTSLQTTIRAAQQQEAIWTAAVEQVRQNRLEISQSETDTLLSNMVRILQATYPLLLERECKYLANLQLYGKDIPSMYVLVRYLRRMDDKAARVYQLHYGLAIDTVPLSLQSTADELNITRERVRQLISKPLRLPYSVQALADELSLDTYEDITPSYARRWHALQEQSGTSITVRQAMGVLCAIDSRRCVVQLSGAEHYYLVHREIIEQRRARAVQNDICTLMNGLHVNPITFDLKAVAGKAWQIFADWLKDDSKVTLQGYTATLLPNIPDRAHIIAQLLADNRKPMSLDDITTSYNALGIEKRTQKSTHIYTIIRKCDSITTIGKSGLYALREWQHVFAGTLTDYIIHVFEQSPVPLTATQLLEQVRDIYPATTERSIVSLMSRKEYRDKFSHYNNGLYGLARKHYDANTLVRRTRKHPMRFAERFEELMTFVKQYRHMPFCSGDPEENRLRNWMYNVQYGTVHPTEDERRKYEEFLTINRDLPQTNTEWNFQQMCDEVALHVAHTFTLPSPARDTRLYHWLQKAVQQQDEWQDNRKQYFSVLLQTLEQYGFTFDAQDINN